MGSRLGELPLFGYGHLYKSPPKSTRIIWVKTPTPSLVPCPYPQRDDPMSVHVNYLTWYEEMYRQVVLHCLSERSQIIHDLENLDKDGETVYGYWEENFKEGLKFFQNHFETFKVLADLDPRQLSEDFRKEHQFWLIFRIESLYSLDEDVRRLVRDTIRRRVLPDFEWQIREEEAQHIANHFYYLRLREETNRLANPQRMRAFWCFKRDTREYEDSLGWEFDASLGSCRMVSRGVAAPLSQPRLQPQVVIEDGFGHHLYVDVLDQAVDHPPAGNGQAADAARAEVVLDGAGQEAAVAQADAGLQTGQEAAVARAGPAELRPAQDRGAGQGDLALVRGTLVQTSSRRSSKKESRRRRHHAGDDGNEHQTMIVHPHVDGGPLAQPPAEAVAAAVDADVAVVAVQEGLQRLTATEEPMTK